MHSKGLRQYRFKQNPEEQRFAEAWELENTGYGDLLAHLLDEQPERHSHPPQPDDRDCIVAATIIQWLGSPVGRCFLRDLGYEKCEK